MAASDLLSTPAHRWIVPLRRLAPAPMAALAPLPTIRAGIKSSRFHTDVKARISAVEAAPASRGTRRAIALSIGRSGCKLPVSMCLHGSDTSTQDFGDFEVNTTLDTSTQDFGDFEVNTTLDTSTQDFGDFEVNTTLDYTEDQQEIGEPVKLYPASEQVNGKQGTEMLDNQDLPQRRKGAKIHDFCLGIPFGGIVFGGGLFGFLFWKTPATSMLSGAAILAMGFISLKVWRQGKSSVPLILGQAAIAATLFWKHFQLYPVTKKLFPSGFYVFVSAAMLCFYSYVLIAGGNPPPKKLAAGPSS